MKVTKIVCHSSNGSMLSLYVEHYCNDTIVERKEQILSNEGDTAFINKFEDGTYSFGIIQGDYYSMGHRKGYIWSSRASVMNKIFGTDIMEVGIKLPNEEGYFSRAVDIKTLKKILPEVLVIVFFAVISFAYFFPADIEGKILFRHDSSAGVAAEQGGV